MKIALLIVFISGCICTGCLTAIYDKLKKIFILIIVLFMLVLYMLGVSVIIDKNHNVPAIEVYRGNTTLQITYQDSVPIDSVVVYKNK